MRRRCTDFHIWIHLVKGYSPLHLQRRIDDCHLWTIWVNGTLLCIARQKYGHPYLACPKLVKFVERISIFSIIYHGFKKKTKLLREWSKGVKLIPYMEKYSLFRIVYSYFYRSAYQQLSACNTISFFIFSL